MNNCKKNNGKIKKGNYKSGRGYCGWFIKQNKQKVYLRSKLEFLYANFLLKTNVEFSVETTTFEINGKMYKPDFFIYNNKKLIKIVEIKDNKKTAEEYIKLFKKYFNLIKIEYEVIYSLKEYVKYSSTKEIENWINNSKTEDMRGNKNPMFGMKHSEKTKQKIGKATVNYFKDKTIRDKHRDGIKKYWESKVGLKRKKEMSNKAKLNLKGKNNPMFGKKHSEETKQKLKDAWIKRKGNN